MRPYLVREERLLLMAQESENSTEVAEAIGKIISSCTFGKVDPKTAPYFDIEWLLLQLRIRSVGESVTPVYQCQNVLDSTTDTRCGNKIKFDIQLNQIDVPKVNEEEKVIKLSSEYHLHLKYPTIFDVNKFSLLLERPVEEIDALVDLFDYLDDVVRKETYQFSDVSHSEKLEFLYSMTGKDIERITTFLSNMPVVQYVIPFKCESCQYTSDLTIKGLYNFFN